MVLLHHDLLPDVEFQTVVKVKVSNDRKWHNQNKCPSPKHNVGKRKYCKPTEQLLQLPRLK